MGQIIELYKTKNRKINNVPTKYVHKKSIDQEEGTLVNIQKQMDTVIKENTSVIGLIYTINKLLVEKANQNPQKMRNLIRKYFMKNDEVEDLNDLLVKAIQEKGLQTGEVNPYLTEKEIASVFPVISMHFIGSILEKEERVEEEQIKRITKICLNALI
ncbi:hypothetical protein [Crassaminicella profunda]|uniref:hypothetical protein n=1 Tax=Crassaminicella profunda TaxID=1286698 RepID=UPI001CA66B7A|nr:hypothetical protein [Crassaminicella profunda]QZY54370.1 hypothetical protein K7H06_15160 [Crassaminicella profunda]